MKVCKIQNLLAVYLPYICSIILYMRIYLTLLLLIFASVGFSQPPNATSEQYILKYKDFAIGEMYRTGVPASIKLAQGIIESQSGNSRLAKEANSHFGIKCKTGWTGKTITADDDEQGECFRAYESVQESYKDHSNFLRDNWRYVECFKLDRMDYIGWADGLRKAGYATNPKYNTLVTGIIERYNLHQYDLAPMPKGIIPEYELKINNVPLVYAKDGETIDIIAQKNDLDSKQIYRYNDLPKGVTIEPGDIIYLKPKRRKGTEPYHIIQEGENLHDISQLYGIKLKQLYKKNHLSPGEEAAVGTKLYLQKKSSDKPETKKAIPTATEKPIEKAAPEEVVDLNSDFYIIKAGDNLYRISEKYHVFIEDILEWNNITSTDGLKAGDKIYLKKEAAIKADLAKTAAPKKEREKPIAKTKTHTVEKGETAYKICKTYGINTTQLMNWNGLKNIESIREGQKLKVGE